MSDVLQRFHQVLVEEISEKRPEYLDGPFTVAEIYQNLVPYGTHRDRLGIEMNGDYEDALLRLLAGEGGHLHLESEHALRDLRSELESSNPNTGLYREFAAVDVRLGTASPAMPAPEVAQQEEDDFWDGATGADDVVEEAMSVTDLAPAEDPPVAETETETESESEAEAETETGTETEVEATQEQPTPAVAPDAPDACPWCRAELPQRDNLHFCPFCGTDVHLVPCPGCGEELEPDWRFCIGCGTEVSG